MCYSTQLFDIDIWAPMGSNLNMLTVGNHVKDEVFSATRMMNYLGRKAYIKWYNCEFKLENANKLDITFRKVLRTFGKRWELLTIW